MSRPGKKRKMPAKPEKPRIDSSLQAFERAFQNRLGQRPIEWITAKLQNGSELSAIQSLFEIMSAEIELQYKLRNAAVFPLLRAVPDRKGCDAHAQKNNAAV